MSDVALAAQKIIKTGIDPVHTGSLSTGDNYQTPNNGRLFIYVTNGGGSPSVVTIATTGTEDGLAIADRTVNVPAGEDRLIGPFPPHIYNNANGEIDTSFSFITSVTVAALNLG